MPVAAGVVEVAEVAEAAEAAEAAEVEAAEAAEAAAAACRGDLAASASALGDWQNVSPALAGAFSFPASGLAAPRTLLAALEAVVPEPPDLEFVSFVTARVGGERPTRLRAHLAGGDAGTSDERTTADRHGIAPGFPA